MSYNVLISEVAGAQLKEAYDHYESLKISLGKDFRTEFKAAIDKLIGGLIDYQIYYGNVRKLTLRRFPYCMLKGIRIKSQRC